MAPDLSRRHGRWIARRASFASKPNQTNDIAHPGVARANADIIGTAYYHDKLKAELVPTSVD
jgi:hypothetical protein